MTIDTEPTDSRRSTPGLIGHAIRQASELFTTEIALMRLEATEKLTLVLASIASLVVAAIFIVVALIFLLQGLVEWLVHRGFAPFEASFMIGGGIAFIALVAVLIAARNLRASRLTPTRTLGQVKIAKNLATRGKA